MYKLQGEIKNGRLLLSNIAKILNSELPEQLRIDDNRIIGDMLREDFKLSTERKGGKYYLIWESAKIRELFLKTGLISPVSPKCPIDNTVKQDLNDLKDVFKEKDVIDLENEEVEIA